jgi:hypothetical protein
MVRSLALRARPAVAPWVGRIVATEGRSAFGSDGGSRRSASARAAASADVHPDGIVDVGDVVHTNCDGVRRLGEGGGPCVAHERPLPIDDLMVAVEAAMRPEAYCNHNINRTPAISTLPR